MKWIQSTFIEAASLLREDLQLQCGTLLQKLQDVHLNRTSKEMVTAMFQLSL